MLQVGFVGRISTHFCLLNLWIHSNQSNCSLVYKSNQRSIFDYVKKIDLHLHTVPAPDKDASFEFDITKFQEFVDGLALDAVAVTNHNLFDLAQFNEIKSTLKNVVVFPGIEIDFESGHLLLIGENHNLDDFDEKCKLIENEHKAGTKITIQKLQDIFPDLNEYLLIPHYDKRPAVKESVIDSLKDVIFAGEVQSPKKFYRIIKESDSLTPVLFSDTRISNKLDIEEHQGQQTFIKTNVSLLTLNAVKASLKDKNKVFLSNSEKHDFFQVFSNGQELSYGLNVVLGGRSSGKTHLLNKLEKAFGSSEEKTIKYIKQFDLVKEDEDDFNKNIEKERSATREKYLKEFKVVVEDVLKIDRRKTNHHLERYIKTLLEYASSEMRQDEFSQAILFKETPFPIRKDETLEDLIKAVKSIIENETYRDTIRKYLSDSNLNGLLEDLKKQYKDKAINNLKKEWVNELVKSIGWLLKDRSASPNIEYNDIDFYGVKIEREKVKRFNAIANSLKEERAIDSKQSFGKFTIEALAGRYNGAGELKDESRRVVRFSEAYEKYDSPMIFLERLNNLGVLEKAELYRFFCKVRYQVLNQYGKVVSGGERAEFNLLKALRDARQYEMLLVDEPESSFDNLFLKDSVNEVIKEISAELPVVVVTHNNTVGMLMQPDYILYTKREIVEGKDEYYVFSGSSGDKEFKTADGTKKVDSHSTLMDALEAGEEAYVDRKGLYDNFKK